MQVSNPVSRRGRTMRFTRYLLTSDLMAEAIDLWLTGSFFCFVLKTKRGSTRTNEEIELNVFIFTLCDGNHCFEGFFFLLSDLHLLNSVSSIVFCVSLPVCARLFGVAFKSLQLHLCHVLFTCHGIKLELLTENREREREREREKERERKRETLQAA